MASPRDNLKQPLLDEHDSIIDLIDETEASLRPKIKSAPINIPNPKVRRAHSEYLAVPPSPPREHKPKHKPDLTILPTKLKEIELALAKPKKETISTAAKLIKDFQIKTRPIQPVEYPVIVFSAVAAFAVGSTAHDFSKRFLNNIAGVYGEGYVWAGTILSFTPQFLLSLRTNIDRWSVIVREFSPKESYENFKSMSSMSWKAIGHSIYDEAVPATITTLSAMPTFKIAVDCEDFKFSPALGYVDGGFRSASALGFNGYFYRDHLQKKLQEAKKDMPIIKMLDEAKLALSHVKNEKLIEALQAGNQAGNFLTHFNDHNDPIEQTNNVVNLFSRLSQQHTHHQHNPKDAKCPSVTSHASFGLVITSSMMNWKAASKVPELFSLKVAKDVLDFITQMTENFDSKLLGTFILGGAVIGLPSWYLNFLANRKACQNAFDRFCKIREEGFYNHFSKYHLKDWGITFMTTVFSIGLGIANGGMGYKYPFLDFSVVRLFNAITSGAVFMGLGFMSVDGFVTAVEDKRDQKLLLDAFNAPNLQEYYNGLETDEMKHRFIVLLKKYLVAVIDSLIGSFAKLETGTQTELLTEKTLKGLGLFSPPIEGDYVDIEKPTTDNTPKDASVISIKINDSDIAVQDKTLQELQDEQNTVSTKEEDDDTVLIDTPGSERNDSDTVVERFREDDEDEDYVLTPIDFSPMQ